MARNSKVDAELDAVRESARTCTACPLYANATQTVFGEGPAAATLMFIGEQPGDKEAVVTLSCSFLWFLLALVSFPAQNSSDQC